MKQGRPTSTPRRVPSTPQSTLLHDSACARGLQSYIDPETGFVVFTRLFHLARGHCCKSGCRHCPYSEAPNDLPSRELDPEGE
jgi:hypothetical protein